MTPSLRGAASKRSGTARERPHESPNATNAEVVGKIVYLRQSYHFGPQKIAMYLKRYHDVVISPSGVWRILQRLDISRLPAPAIPAPVERWKRYEKPQPGHRVQIDVKFVAPLRGHAEALPVHRDRRLHPDPGPADLRPLQPEDRDPVRRLRAREAPLRGRVIQIDNGAEFQSQFHYHVLDAGSDTSTSGRRRRANGKVERSHRSPPRSSTACSTASHRHTELFNDRSGWEDSTTATGPTADLGGKRRMRGYARPRPGVNGHRQLHIRRAGQDSNLRPRD